MGLSKLFVAVPLSDEIRHDLSVVLRELELPGTIQAPGDWHLTLRFIGPVDDPTADRLVHELSLMPVPQSFDIVWGALGAFPRADRATVVWLGIGEGEAELSRLATDVESAVQAAGVPADDRPFRPHLTLSRVRPPRDVGQLIEGFQPLGLRMRCDRIELMESRLDRPRGARYRTIDERSLR